MKLEISRLKKVVSYVCVGMSSEMMERERRRERKREGERIGAREEICSLLLISIFFFFLSFLHPVLFSWLCG